MNKKLVERLFENAKEKAKDETDKDHQYTSVKFILRDKEDEIEVIVDEEFDFEIIDDTIWLIHIYNNISYSHVINLNDIIAITDEV